MKMEEKPQKAKPCNKNIVQAAANSLHREGRGDILSDILGSYTGTAADGDVPEQDPDDL